jgi:hypothetical protein
MASVGGGGLGWCERAAACLWQLRPPSSGRLFVLWGPSRPASLLFQWWCTQLLVGLRPGKLRPPAVWYPRLRGVRGNTPMAGRTRRLAPYGDVAMAPACRAVHAVLPVTAASQCCGAEGAQPEHQKVGWCVTPDPGVTGVLLWVPCLGCSRRSALSWEVPASQKRHHIHCCGQKALQCTAGNLQQG